MNFSLLWFNKNLKNKVVIRFMIIITLAFALVVSALIFTESMIKGMENRLVYLNGGHLRLNSGKAIHIEGTSSEKVITGFAMIYSSDKTAQIMIKGVSDDYLQSRNKYLKLSKFIDDDGLIISNDIAEKLNLEVGDYLALMIMNDEQSKSVRPNVCKVIGLYNSGYSEIDNNLAFTSLDYSSKLYPSDSNVSFEYIIDNYNEKNLNRVKSFFRYSDYTDWRSANYNVYSNFITSYQSIVLILFMLVIFSSFITLSLTQQIINDRSKDIAVIKLMGATDIRLIKTISFSVISTVFLSLFIGMFLGLLLGKNLPAIITVLFGDSDVFKNYLLDFETVIPWLSVFKQFLSEIILSFIFIIVSSFKSKKITPILLFR